MSSTGAEAEVLLYRGENVHIVLIPPNDLQALDSEKSATVGCSMGEIVEIVILIKGVMKVGIWERSGEGG